MAKTSFKPGNMLYPLPAVMVSCKDADGISNILTVAWTGTICTNPPMVYICIRPERHSYPIIRESGEFVINLTTRRLVRATDYCGVRSGRTYDKFADCHLTPERADFVNCPMIKESPVNLECRVTQILELGSHHMFLADVVAVHVDSDYIDDKNTFHLNRADLIAYSHGSYFALGEELGRFGYSVQKRGQKKQNTSKKKRKEKRRRPSSGKTVKKPSQKSSSGIRKKT